MKKKVLFCYLRDKAPLALVFTIFLLINTFIIWMGGTDLDLALYSLLLCAAFVIITGAVGYYDYLKKHKALERIKNNAELTQEPLPEARGLLEEDYSEAISRLRSEKNRLRGEVDAEKSELGDYYNRWAHQIKTPIAAMKLLLESGESDRSELLSELFKIEQYVSAALNYARLDGSDLLLSNYNLCELVRASVRRFASQFIRKKLSVQIDIPENTELLTDEKWFSFIVEQLLSNAVKYTSTGGVRIYLCGDKLYIEDSGMGIRAEDLPRVFEKGYTGYNGRVNSKSTGLGLYLCKRTADMLEHSISIESQIGKGTTVCIGLKRDVLETE